MQKCSKISRVIYVMHNPLSGKNRLIVNTWFTQILLITNSSKLSFTLINYLSKLFIKGELLAQMWSLPTAHCLPSCCVYIIQFTSILLSFTILIMATNSQFEKFEQRFGFVVSSTGAIAVSSYEWNTTNNDVLLVGIKLFQII